MKKGLKCLLTLILIGLIAFIIFRLSDKYRLKMLRNNMECTIVTKGCNNGKSLVYSKGDLYIAFNNYIKFIDKEGKEKIIYKNYSGIEDIEYNNQKLYILSKNNIIVYNLENVKEEILFSNIPESGNGISRKLLVNNNELYLTIGTITNSGVYEDGSKEIIDTKDIEGINNGSIYRINLKDSVIELYASGIRGITGLDITDNNEMYAIFSGMKNEGTRAINRDKDYIYKVALGKWYGWPDFSGGDYISSPRFAGEELVKPIMEKEKAKVVDGPIYVNKSVDMLRELAIDKKGIILPKNSLIFWDKEDQAIYSLIEEKIILKVIKLDEKSYIEDIIYTDDGVLILDSNLGCIYNIHKRAGLFKFNIPVVIKIYILVLILMLLGIFIRKKYITS